MHDLGGLQNPNSCHWSDEFQKIRIFFGKSCSRGFGAPGCRPGTLIDLVNVALDSRNSVKTICMICEGYRTHRAVTGPMSFKKSRRFVGKTCSRIFGAPGCHPSTLIDFANNALVSKSSVEPECMISEGYRTHGGVTGPMNFKKRTFFFRKIVFPVFWDTGCHACNLIDLVNTALARKDSAENMCMISEGYKAHRGVTGRMNFKKLRNFFWKIVLPGFRGSWLPSKLLN